MNEFKDIEGLVLREESSTGKSTCPMGFPMNQNRMAVPVWAYAMELYPPVRIVELGSYNGGFAICLGLAGWTRHVSVHSFDRQQAPTEGWEKLAEFLNVSFCKGDIFELEDYIGELINRSGRTYVLCDGGDKVREFGMCARFLKPGDVLAAHDLFTPYWPFCEVDQERVRGAVWKHNLEPWMQPTFDLAGWLVYKKR